MFPTTPFPGLVCSCVLFFSSRRRHTRFDCDWSSDVCSSDLFNREIYDLLPDKGDMEDSTFPELPKEKFLAFKSEGYWKGFDTIKDLNEAETKATEIFSDLV